MEEEIKPIEEEWARGWVRGIARALARGPPEERPEEYAREVEAIEKVGLEKGSVVFEKAKKWRRRLLEVLRP